MCGCKGTGIQCSGLLSAADSRAGRASRGGRERDRWMIERGEEEKSSHAGAKHTE